MNDASCYEQSRVRATWSLRFNDILKFTFWSFLNKTIIEKNNSPYHSVRLVLFFYSTLIELLSVENWKWLLRLSYYQCS
jgi:hypothetical protein